MRDVPVAALVRAAAVVAGILSCTGVPEAQSVGCTISTTPVSFGTYDVFAGSDDDSTGSVSYSCFLSVATTVRIDLSRGNAASYTPRQMTSGSEVLSYNLYSDAARTSIWGDGTEGTTFFSLAVTPLLPTSGTQTVYGRIPSRQDAAVGGYSDSIVATITF